MWFVIFLPYSFQFFLFIPLFAHGNIGIGQVPTHFIRIPKVFRHLILVCVWLLAMSIKWLFIWLLETATHPHIGLIVRFQHITIGFEFRLAWFNVLHALVYLQNMVLLVFLNFSQITPESVLIWVTIFDFEFQLLVFFGQLLDHVSLTACFRAILVDDSFVFFKLFGHGFLSLFYRLQFFFGYFFVFIVIFNFVF